MYQETLSTAWWLLQSDEGSRGQNLSLQSTADTGLQPRAMHRPLICLTPARREAGLVCGVGKGHPAPSAVTRVAPTEVPSAPAPPGFWRSAACYRIASKGGKSQHRFPIPSFYHLHFPSSHTIWLCLKHYNHQRTGAKPHVLAMGSGSGGPHGTRNPMPGDEPLGCSSSFCIVELADHSKHQRAGSFAYCYFDQAFIKVKDPDPSG